MFKIASVRINIPTHLDKNYGKRPNGATIIPWTISMEQCPVWDFTSSDTFAASYINQTKGNAGAD